MKILMAGGGSGGHVTPLRSIIKELSSEAKEAIEITVVTDRGFYEQTQFLFKMQKDIRLKKIFCGKFRRYNSKSLIWHLTHLPTVLKNIRDVFYIGVGLLQSVIIFASNKPDVVFCKGGFVCVPIGIAAKLFRVPLLIHDSDTHPGLTNRILSRWARVIATGMPTMYYSYPSRRTIYTGIPVSEDYKPVSESEKRTFKLNLKFDATKPLLLVTGGGTGAQVLNDLALTHATELLDMGWQIALITGKNKSKAVREFFDTLSAEQKTQFKFYEFTESAPLVLAADVIVSRAGATAMQEFANAAKPVLIVPSPYLTGAHQLKNAQMFLEQNAALVLQESELATSNKFIDEIQKLAKNKTIATMLHTNFAKPNAAKELASLLVK